jgi:hypothetical protein
MREPYATPTQRAQAEFPEPAAPESPFCLTDFTATASMTAMTKIQVYLHEEELAALREAARRSGKTVAALVREAVRQTWLRPTSEGPVNLWDREPRRTAAEHDTVYDEP